jgi:hypothetical protein
MLGVRSTFFTTTTTLEVGTVANVIPWGRAKQVTSFDPATFQPVTITQQPCILSLAAGPKTIVLSAPLGSSFFHNEELGNNPLIKIHGNFCYSSLHCPATSTCFQRFCLPSALRQATGDFPNVLAFTTEKLPYFPALAYSLPDPISDLQSAAFLTPQLSTIVVFGITIFLLLLVQ